MKNTQKKIVQLKQNSIFLPRTIQYSAICLLLFTHSLANASDHLTPIQATDHERLGNSIQFSEQSAVSFELPTQQFRQRSILGNTAGFEIDTSQREQSRNAYNSLFSASMSVASEWDGNVSSCDPGSTSNAYKQAVLTRINYFRAMAGVPATISLNAAFNNKAQQAALMMAGQNDLSHHPDTSWSCYTTGGAEAASLSNLSLGNSGYDAVFSQMRDDGSNNAPVGHRRWLLYPQTQEMGTGDIPTNNTSNSANDVWVIDSHYNDARPVTRESFVSWPPAGYTPASLAFNRWSFSWPDADFSSATVQMTRLDNGQSETLVIEYPISGSGAGAGEPTIVWAPGNIDPSTITNDTSWEITINNFVVDNQSLTQNYQVTLFDPTKADQYSITPIITGQQQPAINRSINYQFSQVPNADDYEYLISKTTQAPVYNAENGLHSDLKTDISDAYNIIETNRSATGTASYHLAHTSPISQFLTINKTLSVESNAQISFDSLLGFAAQDQVAELQISIDNGTSWTNLYQQAGNGGVTDGDFHQVVISLSDYAQRLVNLRFVYAFESGSFYPQSNSSVGWFIDNVQMQNVKTLSAPTIQAINQGQSSNLPLTISETGDYMLAVRATIFGGYPLEWGDAFALTASNTNTNGSTLSALNIDGDSAPADALTDGLMILRYMFGLSGSALINNTVQTDCTFCDADSIKDRLDSLQTQLDIDGDGNTDALTDGLLIIRYLFGIRGTSLTLNAVSNNCTRCDPSTVEVYLAGLM
jgi:uncharacterized protein YkwD